MPEKMDPKVLAGLRRQELDDAVRNWTAQLDKEVTRHRRRAERHRRTRLWEHMGDLWEKQAVETLSLWDLIRRGLDPKQERRFVGRVSLTVRCKAKGHVLALVYPTCALPVFVPSVRALPYGRRQAIETHDRRAREFARQHFPWSLPAARDPWIEQLEDDEGEVHYVIRGLMVLQERHRSGEVRDDQLGTLRTAFYLLCRCGQQMVSPADVMGALDKGDSHLTAVYSG